MQRLFIALLIAVLIGGGVYMVFGKTAPVGEAPEVSIPSTWTTASITEEGETYTVNVKYPVFNIPSVDAAVKASIDAGVAEIKSLPANPPESATPKHEFGGDVGEVYMSENLVSAELQVWQYTGGAHPMPVTVGVNVNPQTGKVLTLDDALSMIGKTLPEVSAGALAQLETKLGEDALFAEGATATPENFATFLVSETEVTFVFQVYQVAAYSAGVQKVSFPRI